MPLVGVGLGEGHSAAHLGGAAARGAAVDGHRVAAGLGDVDLHGGHVVAGGEERGGQFDAPGAGVAAAGAVA